MTACSFSNCSCLGVPICHNPEFTGMVPCPFGPCILPKGCQTVPISVLSLFNVAVASSKFCSSIASSKFCSSIAPDQCTCCCLWKPEAIEAAWEALQNSPHGISHGPRFTTKKQHSLHQRLVKHAKDPGVSTFSVEKLGQRVPLAAGPPEVGMQGPPIRVIVSFLPP